MRQFDDFLAQESAEGEWSSSGEFTLKLEHALKKLAEMALNAKEEWVLKVVQAAVVAGTPELDFRIGRRGIQVDLGGSPLDLTPCKDGLLNPNLEPEPFWKELFVGLRTLLPLATFQVVSGSGDWIEWKGGELQCPDEARRPSPDTALTLVVIPNKRLSSKEVLNYLTLLETRALYAPLTLRLDGRELRPSEVHAPPMPEFGVGVPRWTAPLLHVHSRFPLSQVTLAMLDKAADKQLVDGLRSLEPFLSFGMDAPKGRESRFIFLKAEYEDTLQGKKTNYRMLKPSNFRLCYTRLGVVCYFIDRTSPIGGVLCLPRDDARSDLAGLKIEPDENNREARSEVTPLLNTLSQSILAHQSSYHYYGSDKGRLRAAFAMSGGAGAIFSLILSTNPLVFLTLGGLAGCAGAATMLNFGRDDYHEHLMPMAVAVQKLTSKMV